MNNNNNNGFREDKPYCYFHPREVVVGVCPLCLNERLLILASTQGLRSSALRSAQKASRNNNNNAKKTPINFHKIFDFGSLLHRLEFRAWKSDFRDHDQDHDYVSTSQEDSFISIKFEENGMASWEKNKNKTTKVSKASQENCNKKVIMSYGSGIKAQQQQQQQEPNYNYKETRTVIEHGKPRASSLRWRKRIGHLFQLIRWKRSNKGTVCHVSNKVEGVKVRKKGWIRTLSKKRTVE